MRLDALIEWLMPRDERFQPLFERQATNLEAAARLLGDLARSPSLEERRVVSFELKRLEHEGDRLTREVFEALNTTFVTPLDREDLRSLASELDEVLDALDRVGRRLVLFELHESPAGLVRFTEILLKLAEEIGAATRHIFAGARQARLVEAAVMRISDLENEADELYNATLHTLFRDELDPIHLLKWKEIYEGLETACDRSRAYSSILAGVLTKIA